MKHRPEDDTTPLSFLTLNIDTNSTKAEAGFAEKTHPQWLVENRMSAIFDTINDIEAQVKVHGLEKISVIHIQESREFTTRFNKKVDSFTPLINFLRERGYTCLSSPDNHYHDNGTAFKFITAYDSTRLELAKSYLKSFSKTPDIATERDGNGKALDINNNYGAEWEKSVFINTFYDKKVFLLWYPHSMYIQM